MPIWQLCANLLIPNCLRSNLSYSPLAALELYVIMLNYKHIFIPYRKLQTITNNLLQIWLYWKICWKFKCNQGNKIVVFPDWRKVWDIFAIFVVKLSYQESISKQNTATRTVCKSLPQKQVILSKSFVWGTNRSFPELQKNVENPVGIRCLFFLSA